MSRQRININPLQFTIDFDSADNVPVEPAKITTTSEANARTASDELIYFTSFGSGSSGNCSYIGSGKGGILVDAGVRADTVFDALASHGVGMDKVKAIILTHDHSDHVRYAYNIVRQHRHMRIYCTNRVLNAMLRNHNISKRIKDYHTPIFKEIPFKICDFEITAFDVPHDGSDNMGYFIERGVHKFAIATDLGRISERAHHYLTQANYMLIEANYDLQMLLHGKYPEYLKARIQTERGHMDNRDTAAFLRNNYGKHLRYIFLCHLSQDNNTPEKADSEIRNALASAGLKVGHAANTIEDRVCDVQLMALPRYVNERWFVFRPK